MLDFIVSFLVSALVSVPLTIGLGVVYFTAAAWLVDTFRLNYGETPRGFRVLNLAVALTIISYFVVFSVAMRRF